MIRRCTALLATLPLLLTSCGLLEQTDPVPSGSTTTGSGAASTTAAPTSTAPKTTAKPTPPATPVRVRSDIGDGNLIGVGQPLVLRFSKTVTDSTELAKATKVIVDGQQVTGYWYWFQSSELDKTLEAHWRTKGPWKAHASVRVELPLKGKSAGKGLAYENDLTLDFNTDAARWTKVDCARKRAVAEQDYKPIRTMPVSCGKKANATMDGTKVVLLKRNPERMVGSRADPYNVVVPYAVKITFSGEYLHSAPWNVANIGRNNTSHGCTNLLPADAQWYYGWAKPGDLVTHTGTGGNQMPSWDGFGDWSVPWEEWKTGGRLPNPR